MAASRRSREKDDDRVGGEPNGRNRSSKGKPSIDMSRSLSPPRQTKSSPPGGASPSVTNQARSMTPPPRTANGMPPRGASSPKLSRLRASNGLVTISTSRVKDDKRKQERIKQIKEKEREENQNRQPVAGRFGDDDDGPIVPMRPAAMRGAVPLNENRMKKRDTSGLTGMNTLSVMEDINKQEIIRKIEAHNENQQAPPPIHPAEPKSRSSIDGNPTFVLPPLVSRKARFGGQSVYVAPEDESDGESDGDDDGDVKVDKDDYEALITECQELQEANEAQEMTIRDLKKQIEALKVDVSRRTELEETKNDELKEIEDKAEEAMADKEKELESMLCEVRTKMDEMKLEYEERISELEANQTFLEAEKEESHSTFEAALKQEKEMAAEAMELSAQLKHDFEVVQKQSGQFEQIASEVGKLKKDVVDLEDQNKELEVKLQQSEAERMESEVAFRKELEEEKAQSLKLGEQLSKTDKEYRENKQSDFTKIRDLEDTITMLIRDKEMLTNKALQLSGKNAGSILRIQELEDELARMGYGFTDTESKMKDAIAKEKALQAKLEEERESRAMVTAHMYFAKKSLKRMTKERPATPVGAPPNIASRSQPNLNAHTTIISSANIEDEKKKKDGNNKRSYYGKFYDILGESTRSAFQSVDSMGDSLLAATLPEEDELERKMS